MTPRRYVVAIRDDNGTTRRMIIRGDREEIDTLLAAANDSPRNLFRTYAIVSPFTLIRS